MKKLITLIICLISIWPLTAQNCNYDYWFAAPDPSQGHGDEKIVLQMTNQSSLPALVDIVYGNTPTIIATALPISGNGNISYDLTIHKPNLENTLNSGVVQDKGIHISSSQKLNIYYQVEGKSGPSGGFNNPEIFSLKGAAALGTDFRIPSQLNFSNQNNNYESREQVCIVATEDNTVVTLTTFNGTPATSTNTSTFLFPFYNVTLNEGETFQINDNWNHAASTLSGMRVHSTKNVAVTISDCSVKFGTSWDLIGDQIIPIANLGTEYLIPRGGFVPGVNNEAVYLMSTVPGTTTVTRWDGGTPSASIILNGVGQGKRVRMWFGDLRLTSDNPIYVYHLTGYNNGNGGDEFGSALIPPLDCTGASNVSFKRTTNNVNNKFQIMLVREPGVSITSIPTSLMTSPNPWTLRNGYWYKTINASSLVGINGMVKFSSPNGKFHVGVLNQVGQSAEYGFLTNFTSLDMCSSYEICEWGDQTTIDAGNGFNSYKWYFNGVLIPGATSSTYVAHRIGTYLVEVDCAGDIMTETIQVNKKPFDECPCCSVDLDISMSGPKYPYNEYVDGVSTTISDEIMKINLNSTLPIRELKVAIIDIDYYSADPDCILCNSNPGVWGSIYTEPTTYIGSGILKLSSSNSKYHYYPGGLHDIIGASTNFREIIWANEKGAMLTNGDIIEFKLALPISPPHCSGTVIVQYEVSWIDAECKKCTQLITSLINM